MKWYRIVGHQDSYATKGDGLMYRPWLFQPPIDLWDSVYWEGPLIKYLTEIPVRCLFQIHMVGEYLWSEFSSSDTVGKVEL